MNLQKVEGHFYKWLQSVSISYPFHQSSKYYKYGTKLGDKYYYLCWDEELYEPLLRSVSQFMPNVSLKTIDSELQNVLGDLFEQLGNNQNLEIVETEIPLSVLGLTETKIFLESLVQNLERLIQTYRILVPVEGIKILLDSGELRIANCTLYDSKKGPLVTQFEPAFANGFAADFKKSFDVTGCYIDVEEIIGDQVYAIEHALNKAHDVVHILNFLIASCKMRDKSRHKINLIGQPAYVRDQVLIYSSPNERGVQGKKLAVFTYEIDKSMLDLWQKYEVDKIAEWYGTEKVDSKTIKAKLKRSIIWCSYAINADTKETQFVSLTTALESLLLDKSESKDLNLNWGSISQRLADRVAFLLGKNYEDRVEFAKKTKKLYGMRSELVHGGTILEDDSSLFKMEDIVYASVIAFAKHNFASWNDFMNWESQQKYSDRQ